MGALLLCILAGFFAGFKTGEISKKKDILETKYFCYQENHKKDKQCYDVINENANKKQQIKEDN